MRANVCMCVDDDADGACCSVQSNKLYYSSVQPEPMRSVIATRCPDSSNYHAKKQFGSFAQTENRSFAANSALAAARACGRRHKSLHISSPRPHFFVARKTRIISVHEGTHRTANIRIARTIAIMFKCDFQIIAI